MKSNLFKDALDTLEHDDTLYLPDNFAGRSRAFDTLDLYRLDDSGSLLHERGTALRKQLEDSNTRLIDQLIARIRAGDRDALKRIIEQVGREASMRDEIGYDELDMLVAGMLDAGIVPDAPLSRDPDMVGYQPTPARIVLKLLDALELTNEDVFYDLGSGLGSVAIMVNLLTGIKAVGVELEKSYCQYALACLKKLSLRGVALIQADARHVSYNDGTIFYLYTPFRGEIFREALAKLEAQSKRRRIRIAAYGPCALEIDRQGWLKPLCRMGVDDGSLGIYLSL